MGERVIYTDARLPTDRFIMDGIDDTQGPKGQIPSPVFSVSEVAKIFFARTSHWLRWRDRNDLFILDGVYVGGRRKQESPKQDGARQYALSDIEKMTHALMAADPPAIDSDQMKYALLTVQSIANVWGLLERRGGA